MRALVIGATGAVGKDLVQLLLSDESFERVDIFVRREVKISAEKLVVHIVDYTYQYEAAKVLKSSIPGLLNCYSLPG